MIIKQKQLLYEIAKWHNRKFYNEMNDHWSDDDYRFDTECYQIINKLEKEYKEQYGDLPEWEYINDIWDVINALEKELDI